MPTQQCRLDLPAGFRVVDLLAFHRRDTLALAERGDAGSLHKGIIWQGHAACLEIRFTDRQAIAQLTVDGGASDVDAGDLARQVRHMLGLTQDVDSFEQAWREDSQLGPLLARQSGLRVPVAATPFEALTWAITGQQISVRAALSLRRKLIGAAGVVHSGGLACYPDATHVAALSEADLQAAGFSRSKANTLLLVSRLVLAGELPLDAWLTTLPVETIGERLLAVRGIGPWTVNYTLLRGFGWLDGSLHGDVAVRRGLQKLKGASEKVGEAAAKAWLEQYAPWRALVAAHLWASLAASAQPAE